MPLFQSRLFLRIISKNREVYLLKIISLAIAFACSTLVILFSLNEFGYDRSHTDSNSVFRVIQRNISDDYSGNRLTNQLPPEIYQELLAKTTDSMDIARVKVLNELSVITDRHTFHHQKIHAADAAMTHIFSFEIVDGMLEKFNNKESTVLLSESLAGEYFGTSKASGKKIGIYTFGDTLQYIVAGVYKDFPKNSHEDFNIFIDFDTLALQKLKFSGTTTGIYGRLITGSIPSGGKIITQLKHADLVYKIQSLPEIYFGPRVLGENARHGDQYSVLILICITSLILFLALTNFINLTTLTLPYRSKELAVKKLMGTGHVQLILSFARESFAVVGISLLLGILILVFTSDLLKPVLALDLVAMLLKGNVKLILILAGLSLVLGIAPLFMAFRFTKATPNRLLSTETITFPRFKRIITFLQLGVSIFLIVASMVIKRQVNYSLLKEPGRNHDQVVYLNYPKDLTAEGLLSLRASWKKYNPNILDVMATSQLPDRISSKELNSPFYSMSVDPYFPAFFDLPIVEGRWFGPNDGDSVYVVNEKGKTIPGKIAKNVIGVIKDMSSRFNLPEKPIKMKMAPVFNYNFLCVRILEVDIRKTVNYLSTFSDDKNPVPISFLNKRFEEWLTYQDRLNTLSEILAIISGLLSCCAIYGLSVSLVRDKLKQIAIHKLCGATIFHITRLLVREFARQMLIAIVIFGPVTYIFLHELLRNFVYTTHFNWLDPVVPLAYCAFVITALCGFQALSLNRADLTGALKG